MSRPPAVGVRPPLAARCRALARAAVFGAGVTVAGLAAAQFLPVPGQEYQEVVNPKRPVSGHAVVGASLVGGQPGTLLHVFVPRGEAAVGGPLRVELDSPDGRFHGSGLFDGSGTPGRWVPIELLPQGRRSQRPADLADADLAVMVRARSGGQARPLLASWGTPDLQEATLRLHVNSRRARISVQRPGGGSIACRPVQSASIVRYDTVCEIPVSALGPLAPGRQSVTLVRQAGFENEPIRYEFWW